jgi:hypothetical protein
MELSFFLTKDLVRLSGLNEDDLKALIATEEGELKPDAANLYAKAVLDKFKAESREQFNRGVREKGNAVEKAASSLFQTFQIESDKVEEGLRQLAEKLQGEPGKPDAQSLTVDEIRKAPAFHIALDDAVAKYKKELEQVRTEYEGFKGNITKEKTMQTIYQRGREILETSNAAFAENPSAQLSFFFKALDTSLFKVDEQGNINLSNADGTPLRDEYGNKIEFNQYIANQWKAAGYGFNEAPAGIPAINGAKGGVTGFQTIESAREALQRAKTPKDKADILRAMAELQRKQ